MNNNFVILKSRKHPQITRRFDQFKDEIVFPDFYHEVNQQMCEKMAKLNKECDYSTDED